MNAYDAIMELFPKLSRDEVVQLKNHCTYRLQNMSAKPRPTLAEEDWLWHGIKTELTKRGMYVKVRGWYPREAGWQTKSDEVKQIIRNAAPGVTAYIELQMLGELAAEALADYIESWNKREYAVSLQHMVRFVHLVPDALEYCYPGYIPAKSYDFVVKHLKRTGQLDATR